jgi:hypothetical protein
MLKTMSKPQKPLISQAEWAALSGHDDRGQVDVYYPIRVWYLLCTCALYAVALIHSSHRMAGLLATDHSLVDRLDAYLLFRGWFVVFATAFGLWAYARSWRLKPVLWGLFFMSLANLMSDLFIVYPERLSHPTSGFIALFLLRLIAILALYVCAKNTRRLPAVSQRFNVFLPLRHTPWFDRRERSDGHRRG